MIEISVSHETKARSFSTHCGNLAECVWNTGGVCQMPHWRWLYLGAIRYVRMWRADSGGVRWTQSEGCFLPVRPGSCSAACCIPKSKSALVTVINAGLGATRRRKRILQSNRLSSVGMLQTHSFALIPFLLDAAWPLPTGRLSPRDDLTRSSREMS